MKWEMREDSKVQVLLLYDLITTSASAKGYQGASYVVHADPCGLETKPQVEEEEEEEIQKDKRLYYMSKLLIMAA